MKFFSDSGCKKEAGGSIDFCEVQVGASGRACLWLRNDSQGLLRKIKVSVSDVNVSVKCPDRLGPGEVAEVVFVWAPPLDMRRGLHADVKVEAEEVYE